MIKRNTESFMIYFDITKKTATFCDKLINESSFDTSSKIFLNKSFQNEKFGFYTFDGSVHGQGQIILIDHTMCVCVCL